MEKTKLAREWHKILSKMLLPDDTRDLAGRAINFSKKQVFEEFFLF